MQELTILGFDFGHGQSSVAKASTLVGAITVDPVELFKKRIWPTALLRRPKTVGKNDAQDYEIFVGERAIKRLKEGDEFFLAFKRRPITDDTYQRAMCEFYFRILEEIEREGEITDWSQVKIHLGCPSQWRDTEVKAYERLFSGGPYPAPTVQRESRAALLHAIKAGLELTVKDLEGAVLVIDVGSSTLDFTVVTGDSREPLDDDGDDLGAGLIDQFILEHTVANHPDRAALEEILTHNPSLRMKLLYLCRQAKEVYFSDPEPYADESVKVGFEQLTSVIMFKPEVDGQVMAAILDRPTDEQGRSWPQRLEDKVREMHDRIMRGNLPLKGIILTGGASRMQFVRDTVRRVFSDIEGIKYPPDSTPEFSIARGLARLERRRHVIDSFTATIEDLIKQRIPPLIEEHLPKLLDLLLPALTKKLITDFAIPEIFRWRNGEVDTMKALNERIQEHIEVWLKSAEGLTFVAALANRWWNELLRDTDLKARVERICAEHDVPHGSLDLLFPFVPDEHYELDLQIPIPLETILRVVGYIILWAIVWVLPLGGPLIAAFIALLFKEGIDEFIDEHMRKISMPVWMRKRISDEKIYSIGSEQGDKICEKLKRKILDDKNVLEKMHTQTVAQLRTHFRQKSDEAARLIR